MSEMWAVEIHDYDSCRHAGYFTSEAEARGYASRLQMCSDNGSVVVKRYDLDVNWRSLPGAYVVELSPEGDVVREGWDDWCASDFVWGGQHGHVWMDNGSPTLTDEGALVRAIGYDRPEALERAREILRAARAPREQQNAPSGAERGEEP